MWGIKEVKGNKQSSFDGRFGKISPTGPQHISEFRRFNSKQPWYKKRRQLLKTLRLICKKLILQEVSVEHDFPPASDFLFIFTWLSFPVGCRFSVLL